MTRCFFAIFALIHAVKLPLFSISNTENDCDEYLHECNTRHDAQQETVDIKILHKFLICQLRESLTDYVAHIVVFCRVIVHDFPFENVPAGAKTAIPDVIKYLKNEMRNYKQNADRQFDFPYDSVPSIVQRGYSKSAEPLLKPVLLLVVQYICSIIVFDFHRRAYSLSAMLPRSSI